MCLKAKIDETMDQVNDFTIKVNLNALTQLNQIFIKNTGGLGLSVSRKN